MVMNAIACRELSLGVTDTRQDNAYVTLISLPLFHSTAQTCQMNTYIHAGGKLVLIPRFDPVTVLELFKSETVTYWVGVPTMHWALLKCAAERGLDVKEYGRSLIFVASGGAPMPVELMRQFEQAFGVRVLEGYGLSETSPVASFNHIEKPSKAGTVGQPLFGVEIQCVDEADRPVPVGERGEVVIRGPNIMKGYYKRPEATAEAMRNGWFHTGDIGSFDADGYLSIVDRKKDMILRGGFNVYPREVEEVLMTHPAISLCAIVGVPDERLGEEVKAFVVLKPGAELTEEALIVWCRDQMAAYKYPRSVEFRSELPTGATGKVLKRMLRT
jgi:long-chain acyl-CoA synthetase